MDLDDRAQMFFSKARVSCSTTRSSGPLPAIVIATAMTSDDDKKTPASANSALRKMFVWPQARRPDCGERPLAYRFTSMLLAQMVAPQLKNISPNKAII
jgi:hypothetical protein